MYFYFKQYVLSCLYISCLELASLLFTINRYYFDLAMIKLPRSLGQKLSLHISNIGQASPQIYVSWKQVFTSLPFLESTRNTIYECERFHYLQSTVYFKSSPYLSSGKLGLSEPCRESDWPEWITSFQFWTASPKYYPKDFRNFISWPGKKMTHSTRIFSWVKKSHRRDYCWCGGQKEDPYPVIASWSQAWNSNSTDISGCREYQQHC